MYVPPLVLGGGRGGLVAADLHHGQYAIRNTQYAIRNTQYAIRVILAVASSLD